MRFIKGFTLAETLITLMIIRVVAVLVVPRFIENYQARERVTAAKVFTKQLKEAF